MTRMWMVDPRILCRQHLLGEHKELHQLVGSINAERWAVIQGHVRLGQVELESIQERHEQLVREMSSRGYNHKSPLPAFNMPEGKHGSVNAFLSLNDLLGRCTICADRFQQLIE